MATKPQKKRFLDLIRKNIDRSGHHIYVISGGANPRFAYTIGVSESIGTELILAGSSFFSNDDVMEILNNIAAQLKRDREALNFEIEGGGLFTLRVAHSSSLNELILGAFDYYQKSDIAALQIVPDSAHWTIDIPDLTKPWNAAQEPAWRWLREPWTYPVPDDSTTVTNLAALRGERITEASRWEVDEWEMFAGAGPDVPQDEMRLVPIGTLVAADESLAPVVHLAVGEGLCRDPEPGSQWRPWLSREPGPTLH